METEESIQKAIQGYLTAAKAISDRIQAANRAPSQAEAEELAGFLDAVEREKAKLQGGETDLQRDFAERKRRDKERTEGIVQWFKAQGMESLLYGDGTSYMSDGSGRVARYGSGASTGGFRPGPWGMAFQQSYRGPLSRSKQLIEPTGSVAVPTFFETLPALTGEPAMSILQFIPTERLLGTDGFSYLKETLRVHRADVVPVGASKPVSSYEVVRVDDRVKTIAHLSEAVPRQYVADIPLLTRYLDTVLKEGFRLELEYQILSGSGVGEEFMGIFNTPGVLSQPWDTDILTTTRKAITTLQAVEVTPTGWALSPESWEECELSTDQQGAYQMAAAGQAVPVDVAARRLWGKPVALSNQVPAGQGILADWRMTHAWEREEVRVAWTESGYLPASHYDEAPGDLWSKNLLMFRCEGREGFGVLRAAAICVLDLSAGS